MQIYAYDSEGTVTSAVKARRGIDYFCPECQKILRLKSGLYRHPHFFHLDPAPSCRQNGKSLTHLSIQNKIASIFPPGTIALEKQYAHIGRIADCAWEEGKIIFEIQCSPISLTEIEERTRDYELSGYHVIWILHEKTFSPYKNTQASLFLQARPFCYTSMSANGKGLFYKERPLDLRPCDPSTFLKQFLGQEPIKKKKGIYLTLFHGLLKHILK